MTLLLVEGEADAEAARVVAEAWNGLRVVRAKMLPLAILTAVLRQAALFLGHDSGVTHLAAAARRDLAVIALFGPTDPGVWAPARSEVQVIRRSETRVDPTVDEVEAAAVAALERQRARPPQA